MKGDDTMKEIRRTKQIGVALSEDEYRLIKDAADRKRLSLASYVRSKFFAEDDKAERKETKKNVD